MEEIFAVRNVDPRTKKFIRSYAAEHEVNTAEALREITMFAAEHLQEKQHKKKYNSFFDTYNKIKFKGPGNISNRIDEIIYDEEIK